MSEKLINIKIRPNIKSEIIVRHELDLLLIV